jgi:hypothetical protein
MSAIILFEEKQVRRAWNKGEEKWHFAITDVIAVLTGSVDLGAYWRKLKERLKKEGNQTVTNCHGLKMTAAYGKKRLTEAFKALANSKDNRASILAKFPKRGESHA